MRYVPVGGETGAERLTSPINLITAERKAVPNATRKYTAAVVAY